jgi:chromosome partitioning protein
VDTSQSSQGSRPPSSSGSLSRVSGRATPGRPAAEVGASVGRWHRVRQGAGAGIKLEADLEAEGMSNGGYDLAFRGQTISAPELQTPFVEPVPRETSRQDPATSARVSYQITPPYGRRRGRVVAVANQKGGVGKSTTAVNLAAYLTLAGGHILVVDLDPQGNASTGLGLNQREIDRSVYEVLHGEIAAKDALYPSVLPGLDVLPSTVDLAGAEIELVSTFSREIRLKRALESLNELYDIIFVDCPPSLGLLTVNALSAADELLIPIQCEYYALEGLGQLLHNIELVRANLNPRLNVGGVALTMYDARTRLAEQVVAEIRKHFGELVYRTIVPRSVRLSEAPGFGQPIALYDPMSRGGIAYRDLAEEVAERAGLLAMHEGEQR